MKPKAKAAKKPVVTRAKETAQQAPISLHGLTLEQAVKAMLEIKPKSKKKAAAKKTARKK